MCFILPLINLVALHWTCLTVCLYQSERIRCCKEFIFFFLQASICTLAEFYMLYLLHIEARCDMSIVLGGVCGFCVGLVFLGGCVGLFFKIISFLIALAAELDFPETERHFLNFHHQFFQPLEPSLDFDTSSSCSQYRISQDSKEFSKVLQKNSNGENTLA